MTHKTDPIRTEYAKRAQRLANTDHYSAFNRAHLYMIQQRQRLTLRLLRREGLYPLRDKQILEVGCGTGGVLLEYLTYEANPSTLNGIDLLHSRLAQAHSMLPNLPLACADGQNLPYATASFDLVMQYTAFSSILEECVKVRTAQEMLRVIKPYGFILWYDFWLNPTNRQTRGIRPAEIRELFPNCQFTFHHITLAPPIIRRLIGVSWVLCEALESLRIFNTHYLVTIRSQKHIPG